MTTKAELQRQWLNLANGLIRTLLTSVIAGLSSLVLNSAFNMGMGWGGVGLVVCSTVIGHLIGWAAKQPIPDVFAIEGDTTVDTVTVTHVETPGKD